VVVLDRRDVGGGSTSASTAMLHTGSMSSWSIS
jgi:hypothetical protein